MLDQDAFRPKKGKFSVKGKKFVKNDSSEESQEEERPKRAAAKKSMKKEEEIKTQEAEKDMEQSGDDVDLDDKILESSQRQNQQ